MVSLANDSADILNGNHVDTVETNEVNNEQKLDNGTSEQTTSKSVGQSVSSKKQILLNYSDGIRPKSVKVVKDGSRLKAFRVLRVNPRNNKSGAAKPACNGTSNNKQSVEVNDQANDSTDRDKNSIGEESKTVTSTTLPTTSANNNVFVLSNLKSSSLTKIDGVKSGSKVFVLNGSVLQSAINSETDERMNIFCIAPNMDGGIIMKQIDTDRTGADNLVDVKKLKTVTTMANFVQISQNNVKDVNRNIESTPLIVAPALAPKRMDSFELLRSKLLEGTSSTSQDLPTTDKELSSKSKINDNCVTKKEPAYEYESAAVAEARSDYFRCRKRLIEAAIHLRMPTKIPPLGYVGPTYSCEECDDTFTSEDSLKKHQDRRSVLFTYACPVCKVTLEFYNRCMFLVHVRSHDAAVKASFLTISMIPANKLNFRVFEDEELIAARDETHASSPAPSVSEPSTAPLRRKIYIRSVEKPDPATIRIVKTLRKKRTFSPLIMTGELMHNTAKADDTIGSNNDSESSNNSASESQLSEANDDTETPTAVDNATSEMNYICIQNQEYALPSSRFETSKSESLPEKPVSLPQVTPDDKKKPVRSQKSPMKAVASSSAAVNIIEEIILTSSDDEDAAPEAGGKVDKLVPCRECKQEVPNLTKHYRGENRPKKEFPCDQCKYFNSSACALSAHVRMHTKSQPYVCPDCGYFFSTLNTFLVHVKEVCFYDFKAIRFKCPECSLLKPSVPQFSEHLLREHTREVFKCEACITSSYSQKVVEQHIQKVHPDTPTRMLEGYWCKLCPNVLISKPLIQNHVNKHVYSLQYLRYVYICKLCKTYATGRMSKFDDHYHNHCQHAAAVESKKVLPKLPPKPPTKVRKPRSVRKSVQSNPSNTSTIDLEMVVEKDPLQMEDWEADKLKAEFKPNTKICVMCRKSNLIEQSSLFCKECVLFVDAEDANDPSNKEILSPAGCGLPKRKFKCKLCKQFMNREWSTITRHFELNHQSDFDVGSRARIVNSDSTTQANAPVNRKRKSSSAKLAPESSKMIKSESPKYKCAKCEMTTCDRAQFYEHIASHKSQSNADFQCLECGMCFIVRPSLEKHLIVEHKIRERELSEYYKENGIVFVEEKAEERKLVDNQCEVCFAECGTKLNYDKHIRSHGMAFVAMQSKAKS